MSTVLRPTTWILGLLVLVLLTGPVLAERDNDAENSKHSQPVIPQKALDLSHETYLPGRASFKLI